LDDDIYLWSNFTTSRDERPILTVHDQRFTQGEATVRWVCWLCIILVVVWGTSWCQAMARKEKWHSPREKWLGVGMTWQY